MTRWQEYSGGKPGKRLENNCYCLNTVMYENACVQRSVDRQERGARPNVPAVPLMLGCIMPVAPNAQPVHKTPLISVTAPRSPHRLC